MDYKMTCQLRSTSVLAQTWTLGIVFLSCLSHIHAITTSVVLLNAVSVQTGSVSSFNCTVTGSGPDPASVVWSIRDTSGNLLSSASLFTTQLFGTADSTDGSVISQGTFTVTQSHLGQRLFCTVTDQGSSSTTSIYTVITATNQANLGQTCSAAISCSPANSRCSNNICVCSTGYTVNGNTCNQIQLGDSCASSSCPVANSICNSQSICACNTNYYASSGSCILKKQLGSSCPVGNSQACAPSDSQCSSFQPYVCECQNGYVQSGSTCVLSQVSLGQACVNPVRQCYIVHSNCNGFVCVCDYQYEQSNNICILSPAGLGESCTNPSRTCSVSDSTCTFGTCQCSNGFVSSGSTCITSTVNLGESCVNPSRTCIVSNSQCSQGVCSCQSGYVASGNSCILPVAGQACVSSVGCVATGSVNPSCVNNVCECPNNFFIFNAGCNAKASNGQPCSSQVSNSCQDIHASCTGTCTCNTGYALQGSTCTQTTTTTSCPANTQNPFTVNGASNFPSTYVGATCYEVNLHESTQMVCEDAKGQPLSAAGWYHMPSFTAVSISTGGFINGDISNTDLTVSNALSNYTGDYMCRLCYSSSRCTNSTTVQLRVLGTEIQSSTLSVSPSGTITKGSTVTLTCSTSPTGVASTYIFYKDSTVIQSTTQSTFQIQNVQTTHIGSYRCNASNTYNSQVSSSVAINVQYSPEFTLSSGTSTQTVTHNFDDGDLVITCSGFSANPAISAYTFYNEAGSQLASSASASYTVNSTQGYQIYYCRATNSLGTSNEQYIDVQEPGTEPGVGASTENTGLGTGTIAAIVLGIIFLLLLIIIIIVCCCSYGWCRKKEKVEPEIHIVSQPPVKPYIPRTIVSATPSVRTTKEVGVMMNGYTDASVSTEEYEPYVASPRYYLKPATSTGPIISMFDDSYEQPRAHQLPALDTQYLYSDDHKPRHKKKRRKHRRSHREPSPRRDVYAEVTPPSDEDLVVVPGKQNYMEADA
ncbi:EGF-like domain-containing protein comC isoform X2 [Mya arenaria]|uniref:EGF-like domain-containing protein comC isoform X2 n=1 Tax=Mya arenaria TaxID=6604 RepID=UPI0022E77CEB|nr:EGF-like domain-containing protein comC isoform X2 [Mya arenaria]